MHGNDEDRRIASATVNGSTRRQLFAQATTLYSLLALAAIEPVRAQALPSAQAVRPFRIEVPQSVLDDLQRRLSQTRWPDQVEQAGWDYGANLDYIQELTAYWQSTYDWRAQEVELNRFAHFKSRLHGLDVHYIKVDGVGPRPMPLLLTHGWSDSFYLFTKLIPMLTDPARFGGKAEDAFTVVAPDIPGFGFSDRPTQPGWGPVQMATCLSELMTDVLGFQGFVAHGEDFGASITEQMALHHAGKLLAIHLTILPPQHAQKADPNQGSAIERDYLRQVAAYGAVEGGFSAIQSSKPQTLSYGLNDSPVGLLVWLVEKFHGLSDRSVDGRMPFTADELLTNVMIYWVTQTGGSAARLYYEKARHPTPESDFVHVPTGFARYVHDTIPPPREFAERFLNIRRWTEMPRGGHYPALEVPVELTADIRDYFREFRPAA